ncbi:Sel1 repeat-containing protein 1 like protein [Habropoda laboriosa]|uniref:Sel1 repeat-containing protein 1 like protein n=2 Tax=Habropoda laboriosa TaxID=597456 RepID=A0A0L7R2L1_9HYME|nr:Sel1 repeat-containing protein 1 like protein [Habropoda laboriosa]
MTGYNLKNDNEVKEYLKNLHTEYIFGCRSEKKPEVCHLLGDYTESITNDEKKAAIIYKENCDKRNFGKSCTKYGDFRAVGRGCKKNTVEAFKYMRKGCDLDDPRGCLHAGALAISAEEVDLSRETEISLGMHFLKKACDLNQEKGCFYLSGLYLSGIDGYVEKNLKEAYVLSLKACEFGNPYACANVSLMHKKGDGVQQNAELAKSFRTRAEDLLKEITKYKKQLKFQQGVDP